MTTQIIKHAEFEETYDDPDHPIPSITNIDVCVILKGGGANLCIVVAKPLNADEQSLTRLLDKIEGYIGHIQSAEFQQDAGDISLENTSIIVKMHPQSSDEAFALLANSIAWVNSGGASLVVERLTNSELGVDD